MSEKKDPELDEFDSNGGQGESAAEDDDEHAVEATMPRDDSASEPVLGSQEEAAGLGAIAEIPVQISAVLGKAVMPVNQLLRLGRGAVVELDRRVGEPINILVNNRLVARGEVVVVEDRLGVTMTEIIKHEE